MKKVRILVVEDESIVGIDLKQTLSRLNYQVLDIVRTGEDAIEQAIKLKPDVILMDIMLDGKINGIEAIKRIKEEIDIPVIYLTAFADENTIQNAKMTDPAGYIVKPFEEKTLHSSIEMALYKHATSLKLKESEERYRELVESSPIAIGIHSEGKVVYANSAGLKLFGANSESEIVGKPIMDLVFPKFRELIEQRIKRAITFKEKLEPLEEKLVRLDGEILDVEVSAIPSEYNGKPAVQVVIRDISEVKKKERIHQATIKILQSVSLSQSLEQQFNYLHKTLIDFIEINNSYFAIHNKENNLITIPCFSDEVNLKPQPYPFGKGLIEYTIESARTQLLDYDKIENLAAENIINLNEKIPKKWLGIPLPLDESQTLVLVFREYFNEHHLGEKELELIKAIILPIMRAIDQKLIEQEKLKTLETLEELNQTKDNFFSIISHDLRSPFDSILGFTEILKNDFDDLKPEEIKLYIDSLYQTSRHIFRLLNNLLQYSKFQLGKTDFKPKSIQLDLIVGKNIEILNGTSLKKEISISNQVQDEFIVFADEDMLNSIILNLLSNALKFTERGGKIIVSSEMDKNFVKVSVQDFGVGMDEKSLNKVFKLNRQKSTPGTENETGTGLGLILVKEFVEKNGGDISVTSKLKFGTTFTFTLPASRINQTNSN